MKVNELGKVGEGSKKGMVWWDKESLDIISYWNEMDFNEFGIRRAGFYTVTEFTLDLKKNLTKTLKSILTLKNEPSLNPK